MGETRETQSLQKVCCFGDIDAQVRKFLLVGNDDVSFTTSDLVEMYALKLRGVLEEGGEVGNGEVVETKMNKLWPRGGREQGNRQWKGVQFAYTWGASEKGTIPVCGDSN